MVYYKNILVINIDSLQKKRSKEENVCYWNWLLKEWRIMININNKIKDIKTNSIQWQLNQTDPKLAAARWFTLLILTSRYSWLSISRTSRWPRKKFEISRIGLNQEVGFNIKNTAYGVLSWKNLYFFWKINWQL